MSKYSKALHRLGRAAVAVTLAGATLACILLAGTTVIRHDTGLEAPAARPAGAAPSAPIRAAGTIHVAIVLGRSGTEAADVLAPYDVFARSPKFTVSTVAETRLPIQLLGGPAVIPASTFSELDSGAASAPDLLVVPAVEDPSGDSEAATRSWIVRQSARGIHILGICSGSMLLAETGVLDGHRATSHWSRIGSLRKSRPGVQWVGGQRFVQDGRISTTAGVTSGIPGALQLIHDLAGPAEAARVGAEVGYPGWSPSGSTAIPEQAFSASDAPVALNAALPWFRPTVGIGLTDGIGEIDAVAPFEVYAVSSAARTVAVAATPFVTTQHGMVLLTTIPSTERPAVDRLILPGTAADDARLTTWAAKWSLSTTALPQGPQQGAAFDAALEELSRHAGSAAAASTAKFIDYPTAHLQLQSGTTDTRSLWLSALAVMAAVGIGALPGLIRSAVRRAPRTTTTKTAASNRTFSPGRGLS